MYAVFKTGGQQYKVSKGDILRVEKLVAEQGKSIDFEQVMMTADGDKVTVGAPFIKNSKVVAEVVNHGRGKKITIIKFKRRKQYRRKMGHRQDYTEIKITDIL